MLWGTPQRGNWWQVVLVSMRLYSVKSRTFDLLVKTITDEDALNWFHHCGLYFEFI
jgi:hypothetical protein